MKDQTDRNIFLSILYFSLSTLITWWFIVQGVWLYESRAIMHLSNIIAGGVWAIQVVGAFLFLKDKKWIFIKRIALVCLLGSCILLPYCLTWVQPFLGMFSGFTFSLFLAVLVMSVAYYIAVKKTGLPLKWFASWVLCLAIAITLQLTVVFKIFIINQK